MNDCPIEKHISVDGAQLVNDENNAPQVVWFDVTAYIILLPYKDFKENAIARIYSLRVQIKTQITDSNNHVYVRHLG